MATEPRPHKATEIGGVIAPHAHAAGTRAHKATEIGVEAPHKATETETTHDVGMLYTTWLIWWSMWTHPRVLYQLIRLPRKFSMIHLAHMETFE